MSKRIPGELAKTATHKITPTRRHDFLELIANGETKGKAARAVGTRRHFINNLLADDPEFAAAYDEARGYENDNIRAEIRARAFDREDAASAKLLEVYAKSRVPEFKQRVEHEHTGDVSFVIESAFPSDVIDVDPIEETQVGEITA